MLLVFFLLPLFNLSFNVSLILVDFLYFPLNNSIYCLFEAISQRKTDILV